jgi:hypothetical protein
MLLRNTFRFHFYNIEVLVAVLQLRTDIKLVVTDPHGKIKVTYWLRGERAEGVSYQYTFKKCSIMRF